MRILFVAKAHNQRITALDMDVAKSVGILKKLFFRNKSFFIHIWFIHLAIQLFNKAIKKL